MTSRSTLDEGSAGTAPVQVLHDGAAATTTTTPAPRTTGGAALTQRLAAVGTMPATEHPRDLIAPLLTGEVLEIGPGSYPFPVAEGARVTFVDRRVEGGRDANWPELIGSPWGPPGDIEADLDGDGLRAVPDGSMDAVILSHVIEHLANPVAALREIERVLRPGGRLALIVPDRHLTFDADRAPTPAAHVLQEFRDGVSVVSEDHIREYCAAIHARPPKHPPQVYAWHDPATLDDERIALHRRRSIHVHCWNPEEFAVLLTALLAEGLGDWELDFHYTSDDVPNPPGLEFGLLLRRGDGSRTPQERAARFAHAWLTPVISRPRRDPRRAGRFVTALVAELGCPDWAGQAVADATAALGAGLTEARADQERLQAELTRVGTERDHAAAQRDLVRARLERLLTSRTYRTGRLVSAPLRWVRR